MRIGAPRRAAAFLRALRGPWLTRTEIAFVLRWDPATVLTWALVMEAHGFIVSRERMKGAGPPVLEFTLAPAWHGPGAP